jgi:hypothetical protein
MSFLIPSDTLSAFEDNLPFVSLPAPPQNYKIKSKDSGGLARVASLLRNDFGSNEDVLLSEFHVVNSVPSVYKTEHTTSTILRALHALESKCRQQGKTSSQMDEIRGAVSSKFFEDSSFRIVAEDSSPSEFKEITVDIDQVRFYLRTIHNPM